MAPERDRQFRMNVADEELEMLRQLAEADGLTASDYLRTAIRRDYRDRFGDKPRKPKK
jgi:hypothetical protein